MPPAEPRPPEAAILGVERSLLGKRWRPRLTDERQALAIAQRLDVPEIIGSILAARGIALEDAERFLDPKLRDLLPDPLHLKDMDAAVSRLANAIAANEPVAVFGDYDVDGATSAALLTRFFGAAGASLRTYIPDRLTEGYGPNAAAMLGLAADGVRVVITVDCGITAFEPLQAAADAGLDVIVVDHHVAEPQLPTARAVVNPNRLDDESPLGNLAAVGVVFMLVIALNRRLREDGWYASRQEPDLMQWLDLVALGTVCDMVPLGGLNRALVNQGLKVMARRSNSGLTALADVAGVNKPPNAYHLGFVFGPRVNAGGRVGEAGLGARLLTTEDGGEAATMAHSLDAYNRERQAIEQAVLEEAIAQTDAEAASLGPAVVAAAEGWHPGVIGIVASRLVARYGRPACVIAINGDVGKGSGRSVRGVDLGAAVIAARQAGLLDAGGGHPMAAGFAVAADKLDELRAFLHDRIGPAMESIGAVASLGCDGVLTVGAATSELLELVGRAGPYGSGNAEPRFAFAGVRIAKADRVGKDHVRVFLAEAGGGRLKGIAFRAADTPVGRALLDSRGGTLHLAGHLRADRWQGREDVQLVIEDAASASGE